jgi:o-succinylbenzoate---CoA ligase
MSQDKGQNQFVIDWLINGDPDRVFVSTPSGHLTYRDLTGLLPSRPSGELTSLVPGADLDSVAGIFRGVVAGPLRISVGEGWLGYAVRQGVMTLLSTSGTTGRPKLVPLSVGNWRAAVVASAIHLGHRPEDTWLMAMPLHHVGGLSVLFRSAHVGGAVRMLPRFDAGSFAAELESGVTIASVVPTMLRRVLDHDDRIYAGLKAVLVGGGPIPAGLLEEAQARGIPALPTYGMTETCAQVATLRPGAPLDYKAHLLPGVEARIEANGRIALRGDQVFSGYLGEDQRSPGDWFVTGDRGELDVDGAVRILGRADDVIVTGGENVDPAGVEVEMINCPGVDEVMVVGVPSEEWGREVVCLYTGAATGPALAEWAKARLKPFQVPKQWIEVGSIPVGPLGKPDRHSGVELASRAIRD